MKTAVFLVLSVIPLAYAQTILEEFETPKVFILVSFACLSALAVNWRILRRDRIAQALGLLLMSAAVSTYFSIDRTMSFWGNPKCMNGFLTWAASLIFYLACRDAFKGYRARIQMFWIWTALAGAVSTYAVFQVFGIDVMHWDNVVGEYGYMRPMSFLGHPNFMSAYLAMLVPVLIHQIQHSCRAPRAAAILVLLLTVFAMLAAFSRGMIIACTGGVATYLLLARAKIWNAVKYGALTAVLACAVFLVVPKIEGAMKDRMRDFITLSGARVEYQKAALRIWKRAPIFGVGTDTYELAFDRKRTPEYWRMEPGGSPHRAHNEFLNVLATQGAFGALAWLLFILALAGRAREMFLFEWHRHLVPAIAAVVAFFIQELSSFHVVSTMTLLLAMLAFLPRAEHE